VLLDFNRSVAGTIWDVVIPESVPWIDVPLTALKLAVIPVALSRSWRP
jgi:hypothetical protein